jgi:hypothetical protein
MTFVATFVEGFVPHFVALPVAQQISLRVPLCRINAAFRLSSERRIYAAAKKFVAHFVECLVPTLSASLN